MGKIIFQQKTHIQSKFRHKVGVIIESKPIQFIILGLLILDLFLLMTELGLEAHFGRHPPHWVHEIELSIYYMTIAILSIFALELFGLFFAFVCDIHKRFKILGLEIL